MTFLTEQEQNILNLPATPGMSPGGTIKKTIHSNGEYITFLFDEDCRCWYTLTGKRSLSAAIKDAKANQKDKTMTNEQTQTDQNLYETVAEIIKEKTDLEILDLFYQVTELDKLSDYPNDKEIIKEAVRDELRIRDLNNPESLKFWRDNTDLPIAQELDEWVQDLTENQNDIYDLSKSIHLEPEVFAGVNIFNELFTLASQVIENDKNLSVLEHHKKTKSISDFIKDRIGVTPTIKNLPNIDINNHQPVTETQTQPDQEKAILIEALKNISPVEKIDTSKDVNNIWEQIKSSNDTLLKSKVDIYLRTMNQKEKNISNLREQFTNLNETTQNPILRESLNPNHTLTESKKALILEATESQIITELQGKNFYAKDTRINFDKFSSVIDDGVSSFLECCNFVKDLTGYDYRQTILEANITDEKITKLNLFEKIVLSEFVKETQTFTAPDDLTESSISKFISTLDKCPKFELIDFYGNLKGYEAVIRFEFDDYRLQIQNAKG